VVVEPTRRPRAILAPIIDEDARPHPHILRRSEPRSRWTSRADQPTGYRFRVDRSASYSRCSGDAAIEAAGNKTRTSRKRT
jgi:hypothetical protein